MYEVFEKLLESYGITIYKFCKDTGVSESTVYTWKKKKTRCSAKLQKIVCEYFKISADYLMTGEEKENGKRYYINEETGKTAQEIFEKDRVLFDVYRSADKDKLVEYAEMLKALREKEEGN